MGGSGFAVVFVSRLSGAHLLCLLRVYSVYSGFTLFTQGLLCLLRVRLKPSFIPSDQSQSPAGNVSELLSVSVTDRIDQTTAWPSSGPCLSRAADRSVCRCYPRARLQSLSSSGTRREARGHRSSSLSFSRNTTILV